MKDKKENIFNKTKNSFKEKWKEFFSDKQLDENKQLLNANINNIEYIHDVIILKLEGQKAFVFSAENAEKISKTEEFIKELYVLLLEYIIKGDFENGNIYEILDAINNYRNRFNNENVGNNEKNFGIFFDNIQSLINDFKKLQDLSSFINFRRKDIVAIYGLNNNGNNKSDERTLFNQLLFLNNMQSIIGDDLNDDLTTGLLSLLQDVSKITDKKYDKYTGIIKDTIILNLFKISLVSGKNKFEYYKGGKIITLSLMKKFKGSMYAEYIDVLRFINGDKVNNIKFIEDYKKDLLNNNISSLGIYVLLKYYKDINKSGKELKKIYLLLRELVFNDENVNLVEEYKFKLLLNTIFAGNYYLSFLIEKYKNNGNNILITEIDNFYSELLDLSKDISDDNYKNYFTYYKYSYLKNIEYVKKSLGKILSYKELSGIVDTSKKAIEKAKKMFNFMEYHNYFEFDKDDFYISFNKEEKFYCHNLFLFPFPRDKQSKLIELEIDKVRENKIDIKYKEKFGNIEESLENNKLEAMTIIGIFTGIVVYSIGTIQIFSIIEDIGSAILFSGIFLSGLLVLIGGIFFKSTGTIGNDFKYNKGLQLFLVALFILVLSFLGKIYLSHDGGILNGNRGKSIYNKLEGKIIEGENIKDYIDEKIKKYNEINKEIKNNLIKLEKIKK